MSELFKVEAGSKWMSNDKRFTEKQRRDTAFEVLGFVQREGVRYAKVKPLNAVGNGHRERTIAVHRFRSNATGYVPYNDDAKDRAAKRGGK